MNKPGRTAHDLFIVDESLFVEAPDSVSPLSGAPGPADREPPADGGTTGLAQDEVHPLIEADVFSGGLPPADLVELSDRNVSAIRSRVVDDSKVKALLSIKALSQDQTLAGDRRQASSSYLGTGRRAGQREAKDILQKLSDLRQSSWKKTATTGNAEPLLRARRDAELCEAVQNDLQMCSSNARTPALLWSAVPPKDARRLGSLDMISDVLVLPSQMHHTPVGQDLETVKRLTFLDRDASTTHTQVYEGPDGEPGSPMGLNHTISRKTLGNIHAEIQVSPCLAATVHVPQDREAFRRARQIWPSASGIGSLGSTFGTSRSLFELQDHSIQEAEMLPGDAFDVATLTKNSSRGPAHSTEHTVAMGVTDPRGHPMGRSTDGLRTIAPEVFGIKSFSSHPDASADSPVRIRSPERTGRPVGFDVMLEETHPQLRSPRQHRRALNKQRGEATHDEKHRMARSIASFRDVLPSSILDITANYQEFYRTDGEYHGMTAAAREAALPCVVTNSVAIAPNSMNNPSLYYMGDGLTRIEAARRFAKSQATKDKTQQRRAEADVSAPKEEVLLLPELTNFSNPVFSITGAAIPISAVRSQQRPGQHLIQQTLEHASKTPESFGPTPPPYTPSTRPQTGGQGVLSRPGTQNVVGVLNRPFTPGHEGWFQQPTTPNPDGTIFIKGVGLVSLHEVDSLHSHFQAFTLQQGVDDLFAQRPGSPRHGLSTRPPTGTSEISFPSRSSVTRQLIDTPTIRDIRSAQARGRDDWKVPRTPLTTKPQRTGTPQWLLDQQRKKAELQEKLGNAPPRSAPRTPKMENAQPGLGGIALREDGSSHLRKSDPLRDLMDAREGFKASKEFLGQVCVVVNEAEGTGVWAMQTLWYVGGLLILESDPYHQLRMVWQAAKRGVPGQYSEMWVYESKLTRVCHVDEMILLQERSLKDHPFTLDVVAAEIMGTCTSKFVMKKGLTGVRAERGDEIRLLRAKDTKNKQGATVKSLYVEFQGYPGKVPADSVRVEGKVRKKSVTIKFETLQQLHHVLVDLQARAPQAGMRLEPRTALLNAFGREGIANAKSKNLRLGLQQAFSAAQERMSALQKLVSREHDMIHEQEDKAILAGMPRRHVMATGIRKIHAVTIKGNPDTACTEPAPPTSEKTDAASSPLTRRSHMQQFEEGGNHSPATFEPANDQKPVAKVSPRKRPRTTVFGQCPVCDKHRQCLVSVPKYCTRCALKSVHDSLNKGDLKQAHIACNHVDQMTLSEGGINGVVHGEPSAMLVRCEEARTRLEEATRLNHFRELLQAANCGAVSKIEALSQAGMNLATQVSELEWVENRGFMTTRSILRGYTAVHYACMAFTGVEEEGKKDALVTLVDRHGLDPHHAAADGRLPMHIAVNEIPCLRYLIFSQKGNVEWKDGDGRTVLHHAAMYGGLDVRIFLIGFCDADHMVQDAFSKTPADYCEDIMKLVSKRKVIKKICSFFHNAMVLKCFMTMKRWKKPEFEHDFIPTSERKAQIQLSARVIRRKLYQDWDSHGHPRLLKPWSSLLHRQGPGQSLQSELSRLSSLDWTNPLEWSWYIARESPGLDSPIDEPIDEVWGGSSQDFAVDIGTFNREIEEEINMNAALAGLSHTLSDYVIHYDAKCVYGLESRPATTEIDGMRRVRTPKDVQLRSRRPNITLRPDGTESLSRTDSLWARVRSATGSIKSSAQSSVGVFTRALSFGRTGSSTSQISHGRIPHETETKSAVVSIAASFTRALSFARNASSGPVPAATENVAHDSGQPQGGNTAVGEEESSLAAKAGAATFLAAMGPKPPAEEKAAAAVLRAGGRFKRAIEPPKEIE